MRKTIVAITLASCSAAAMADVVLYGQVKAGVQSDAVTGGETQGRVEDYASFVGFKGEEGLGDGLRAVWQIENRVHADGEGTEAFASRQTFIGLKSDALGMIRAGYLDSALNDMGSVDPWSYSSVFKSHFDANGGPVTNTILSGANGLGVFTRTGQRLKNAIRYDTATLGGFSGVIVYGFGENKTPTSKASDVVSLGGGYRYGNYFGRYGYQREANPDANASVASRSASVHRLEGGYDDSKLLLVAGLQRATGYDWGDGLSGSGAGKRLMGDGQAYSSAQRGLKTREAALTASYTIGQFRPTVSLARGWNQEDRFGGSLADTGYRQFVAGVDYLLSKRTTLELSAGAIRFDKNSSLAVLDSNGVAKDTTVRTLAVGLSHTF